MAQELEPLLRRAPGKETRGGAELAAWTHDTLSPAMAPLLTWSDGERRFLERLTTEGEIEPEALHDDPDVQNRIRTQPMLRWKAEQVRKRRMTT